MPMPMQQWSKCLPQDAPAMRKDADGPAVQRELFGCGIGQPVYLRDDVKAGNLAYVYTRFRSESLHPLQFARWVGAHATSGMTASSTATRARQQCDDRSTFGGVNGQLSLRMLWCVQPYRSIKGLFDVQVWLITLDREREALVVSLSMQGLNRDFALWWTRKFVATLE